MPLPAQPVLVLWALSVLVQVTLFYFLFRTGNFRTLPFLTWYVALNLSQAGLLLFLYSRFAPSPHDIYLLSWGSEAVTLILQAFAATETMRLILKPYPGIWGLSWRVLTLAGAVVLIVMAFAAGNMDWVLVRADRGYHLTFAVAFIACQLLVRYYAITIPRAYKFLLAGFCTFSVSMVLINTVFQSLVWGHYPNYRMIWDLLTMLPFAVFQVLCLIALSKRLPEDTREPAWSSDEVYRQLTPEISAQLQQLNGKLARIWKPEVRSE